MKRRVDRIFEKRYNHRPRYRRIMKRLDRSIERAEQLLLKYDKKALKRRVTVVVKI